MRRTLTTVLFPALIAGPLAAQVGHAPASSPYRDIPDGKTVTLLYGKIAGDGGQLGVGAHDGKSYGVRFDVRVGAPIQLGLAVARGELKRLIFNSADTTSAAFRGPVSQDLTMVEAALQINLTGRKTWYRLAPFIGGSAGFVVGSDLPASQPDSSGYRYGTKFYFAPAVGVRVFVTHSIHLRLEARQLYWKLTYPAGYSTKLASTNLQEWTGGRELRAGLGIGF
jgi:hypothetical protein